MTIIRPMKILVGCETSGVVRRAFAARGHDVWSCDLLPAEDGSNRHIIGDVRDYFADGWDLLAVLHPPCTRVCNSGVRWLSVPPPLVATNKLTPPQPGTAEHKAWSRVHRASPGPDRWKERSRTYDGIAAAMADQWGGYAIEQARAAA